MRLVVPTTILKRLQRELRRGGAREIGGLLMGEHVGEDVFRLVDFSVQHAGGTHASFERDPARHRAQLDEFFGRTGRDYSRFNYLGEWHSHPRFEPLPSAADIATMQSMVEDPAVGANFLVLLIARRTGRRRTELSATAFRPGMEPAPVMMSFEPAGAAATRSGWLGWWFSRKAS
jgi:integrative and conjugative element protein (TIGR02256 family)